VIITAKFDSTCKSCGRDIAAGEIVRWERGAPATHVDCAEIEAKAEQEKGTPAFHALLSAIEARYDELVRAKLLPSEGSVHDH